MITGDEEGPAIDGTVKVLEWMRANDQIPDFCLVGEPTCPVTLGDMVKIGRRGSVNMKIEVHGTQGHVAYPHRADNPVHRLIRVLDALTAAPVDAGTDWFEPSTLQVTSIDVGNVARRTSYPASARAALNIRFNDAAQRCIADCLGASDVVSVCGAVRPGVIDQRRVVRDQAWSAGRHSSQRDLRARPVSIRNWIPAAAHLTLASSRITAPSPNLAWSGATMHQTDECVPVAELRDLARIYRDIIAAFLA